jgi:hypothetical protein
MQIANRCAPVKIANSAENSILQALQFLPLASKQANKEASSSLLLTFASMVILGVEPHRDP